MPTTTEENQISGRENVPKIAKLLQHWRANRAFVLCWHCLWTQICFSSNVLL